MPELREDLREGREYVAPGKGRFHIVDPLRFPAAAYCGAWLGLAPTITMYPFEHTCGNCIRVLEGKNPL